MKEAATSALSPDRQEAKDKNAAAAAKVEEAPAAPVKPKAAPHKKAAPKTSEASE